jgi:hypothetical protein
MKEDGTKIDVASRWSLVCPSAAKLRPLCGDTCGVGAAECGWWSRGISHTVNGRCTITACRESEGTEAAREARVHQLVLPSPLEAALEKVKELVELWAIAT